MTSFAREGMKVGSNDHPATYPAKTPATPPPPARYALMVDTLDHRQRRQGSWHCGSWRRGSVQSCGKAAKEIGHIKAVRAICPHRFRPAVVAGFFSALRVTALHSAIALPPPSRTLLLTQ